MSVRFRGGMILLSLALASFALHFLLTAPFHDRLATLRAENLSLADTSAALQRRAAALAQEVARTQASDTIQAWQASTASAAAIDLQTAITATAGKAGVSFTTFGPAAGPAEVASPTVGFQAEGDMAWSGALAFMQEIEHVSPPVTIADLTIRAVAPVPDAPDVARVYLRLVIWGFARFDPATTP